jgi:hypothetical protein
MTDCFNNDCVKYKEIEWTEEVKAAIALLEKNDFQVFFCPMICIAGTIANQQHDLQIFYAQRKREREEEELKAQKRRKREENKLAKMAVKKE